MMIEAPDDFVERVYKMETQVADMHAGWNNGGSPATKRMGTRLDGFVLCGVILISVASGWLGWLTLQVEKFIK